MTARESLIDSGLPIHYCRPQLHQSGMESVPRAHGRIIGFSTSALEIHLCMTLLIERLSGADDK